MCSAIKLVECFYFVIWRFAALLDTNPQHAVGADPIPPLSNFHKIQLNEFNSLKILGGMSAGCAPPDNKIKAFYQFNRTAHQI